MGNKDRKTDFEKLVDDVAGRHSKRMNAMLMTMDDEAFSVAYFKVLEYAKPKLQRQELNVGVEVNKVTIERVDIPIEKIEKE